MNTYLVTYRSKLFGGHRLVKADTEKEAVALMGEHARFVVAVELADEEELKNS